MTMQILLGEDQKFTIKTDMSNLIMAAQVSGSEDNELFYRNLQFQEEQVPEFQRIAQEMAGLDANSPAYLQLQSEQEQLVADRKSHLDELFTSYPNSLFSKFKMAGQNPDLQDIRKPDGSLDEVAQLQAYRRDFWDGVDFSDERLLRTPVIANKLGRYMKELIPQHQDSIIKYADLLIDKVEGKYPGYFKFFTNWVPLQYQPTKSTLMDAEAVMVHMVQNYFTEEKAFWSNPAELQGLQQRAMEMQASLVGRKGPDVISTDPSGRSRSIYEMKQPYVIVLLYNPECEHCIEETPQMLSLYNRLKKDLGIYAIAIDTDDTKWRNFIQNFGTQEWVNVYDPTNRSIYAKYFVDKTPEIYVLNPDRTIIGKNLKVFQVEEIIRRDRERRGS
jgi:thiol-disulfide isomerase/thioredoxin